MKALFITILVCIIFSSLFSENHISDFDHLSSLQKSGVRNADLFYNLGVVYWQSGQSGLSTLYFLRALNVDSAHKLAKENLEYVVGLSQDKGLYPNHQFLVRAAFEIYDFLNINRLAIITLVLLLGTVLSLHWLLFYDENKERGFPILVFSIVLCIFLFFASITFVKAYRQTHNNKAVVTTPMAKIMVEADENASKLADVHEGLILVIEYTGTVWSKVHLPDGVTGWVLSSNISKVL